MGMRRKGMGECEGKIGGAWDEDKEVKEKIVKRKKMREDKEEEGEEDTRGGGRWW